LSDLFPDLGESSYENWDFKQGDVLLAFMNQRMIAAPDEPQHIWKLDGPLEDAPHDEVPSTAWLQMAHAGPLPPLWDLLAIQPSVEPLHLLSIVEFTDLLNGCAPDALVRNAFVILRMVATARCDITAHTVLLYVLFCLIYMYCTLYVLYILHTVHTVHVPCFPVTDVEGLIFNICSLSHVLT
jgi:hypothetical protein